jgi:hypothetical protein
MMESTGTSARILKELQRISQSVSVDPLSRLEEQLELVMSAQEGISEEIRPLNRARRGGGLIRLDREIPLIVVPDLHARKDFLYSLLATGFGPGRVVDALENRTVQILCVGDGFHSEKRGWKRWQNSLAEYTGGYRKHRNMDREMAESLGLMQMVMLLQTAFPDVFFFLKGNHENILNEEGNGNHPFGKFVYEGEMVRAWVERFLGEDYLYAHAEYESRLPYLAVGENLLISHAEPAEFYSPEQIIEIDSDDSVKLGLTWTGNGQAAEGSVEETLEYYSSRLGRAFTHYIGGHRTIHGLYNLRAGGRYIQIHNPDRFVILYTDQQEIMDPRVNIVDLREIRRLPL